MSGRTKAEDEPIALSFFVCEIAKPIHFDYKTLLVIHLCKDLVCIQIVLNERKYNSSATLQEQSGSQE